MRSEEHTSELQSRFDLVCRLLLEKKKKEKTKRVMRLNRPPDLHTLSYITYYYRHSSYQLFFLFFLHYYCDHRDLLSFPTRRSSDLVSIYNNLLYILRSHCMFYNDSSKIGCIMM